MKYRLACWCLLLTLNQAVPAADVAFDWFEYTGRDAVFSDPLQAGQYRNPILAGFHPDPAITRVGSKFYLVTSTFTYFPGIPVFESADLVHWQQIGNVIERQSQVSFDGLSTSRGIYAPSIAFNQGMFYVLSTAVESGGNFIATATNPAGPWSDLQWLPEIDGIDPSIFFADGKAWILNNGKPEGVPLYDGHRAIWIQEYDLSKRKLVGPRKVLVNGGVDISTRPIWIEGPHMFAKGSWYYLSCAEGGTGPDHSQVILRSRSPLGPFKPFVGNPILTQRDLPANRDKPITNAGHADLVEAPDGSWWAIFLASRPYEPGLYNTGRETFLLPVVWRDEWPIILDAGKSIPWTTSGPKFMGSEEQWPLTGNFTLRDEFDGQAPNREWLQLRTPQQAWFDLTTKPGSLTIHSLPVTLDSKSNPSFLARRQQHQMFDASTTFRIPQSGVSAGLAAFQNEGYWFYFGVRKASTSKVELFVEKKSGRGVETIASMTTTGASRPITLKVSANARWYSFAYSFDGRRWSTLRADADGSILSTKVAEGFVGAVVGPYARSE